MFEIDNDMTIYITRGDIAFFSVTAENNGERYKFQPGDVVRIKVYQKKNATNVAFQKDFPVLEETDVVDILLTEEETRIGDVISKPVDYWYEVELNPYSNPQTIIGYDDDGPKIFKLFPEGKDLGTVVKPEDVPVVDAELSLTSDRPVQNQAIARAMNNLIVKVENISKDVENTVDDMTKKVDDTVNNAYEITAKLESDLAIERARINNLTANTGEQTEGNTELIDIRVAADGTEYATAGEAVRAQIGGVTSDLELNNTSIRTASKEISGAEFFVLKNGYYRLAASGSIVDPDTIHADSELVCVKVACAEGEQITINGNGSSYTKRLYAFVDNENTVLYLSSNNLTGKRTIVAPANCAYALINILANSEKPYVYKGTLSTIETNELLQDVGDSVSYVTKDFEQGAIAFTGAEGSSKVYCRTDFIGIETIKRVFKPSGMLSVNVCLYDSDKVFIDRITSDLPDKTIDYNRMQVISAWGRSGETKYVRFSIKRIVDGTEANSTPTDIVNSGLEIELYGVADSIYNRVVTLEQENASVVGDMPSYYSDYILDKVNTINERSDTVGQFNDNFIFLTDYHWQSNAGNSMSLIKHIVANTGITKMFFGGDAGKSSIESDKYGASRLDAKIFNELWQCVPNFYGMLGNHEWNDRQDETHEASKQSKVYSRTGVVNFYLRREQKLVGNISNEGNYYVDNAGSKNQIYCYTKHRSGEGYERNLPMAD